ncbi:uncharacterized protein LOC135480400 [Liolophura sinensis]|uniref:uncharacterized protein LOC135480400 n=1 Tax=Liolophura sinensis TaxID=3198878 RepID=UPI0031590BC7
MRACIRSNPIDLSPVRQMMGKIATEGRTEVTSKTSEGSESEQSCLQNTEWCGTIICKCGNCIIMPSAAECVCCPEITVIYARCEEMDVRVPFITGHRGFEPVCLNPYVFNVTYYPYMQQCKMGDNNETVDQFVQFCWRLLGKSVRLVIPSRAVAAIPARFSSSSGDYTGFMMYYE